MADPIGIVCTATGICHVVTPAVFRHVGLPAGHPLELPGLGPMRCTRLILVLVDPGLWEKLDQQDLLD